jgi:hypothetical protein
MWIGLDNKSKGDSSNIIVGRTKIVSNVINNLKNHNHAVFASNIVRQNTNTIAQYNTEIWDKKILIKN